MVNQTVGGLKKLKNLFSKEAGFKEWERIIVRWKLGKQRHGSNYRKEGRWKGRKGTINVPVFVPSSSCGTKNTWEYILMIKIMKVTNSAKI